MYCCLLFPLHSSLKSRKDFWQFYRIKNIWHLTKEEIMISKRSLILPFFLVLLVSMIVAVSVSCSGKKENDVSNPVMSENSQANTDGESNAEPNNPEETEEENEKENEDKNEPTENTGFVFPIEGVRPVAVMIDNEGTKSLPQGGLHLAQLIYEAIVEGGETRLMPVFWGTTDELVGPVRSSRHYFLDYAMEHDAIYVHYGWSPMAITDIKKFKIDNINGVANGGEIFWDLTKDKYNWQDSYTSFDKIREYVNKVKYRTNTDKKLVFSYNKTDVQPSEGQNAVKVNIRYSHAYTCGFEYDSLSGTYKRFRKGKPQMERVTGEQLTAKNIIIQYVNNYTIKGDTEGRQELDTVGSGKGWFITKGKAVPIKWSKKARETATLYTDEKGNAITLNPGQTWIQIVPLSGKVEME